MDEKKLTNTNKIIIIIIIITGGSWNESAIALVQEIGKRITVVTKDVRETSFLFQCLSLALHIGNVASILGTFPTEGTTVATPIIT